MKVLQPVAISDATLISSSVAEADAAAWAGGTTYAVGNRVMVAHRVFESLVAGNLGNAPATAPDKWLDVGPTNRWGMLGTGGGTQTTAAASIDVTLAPASPVSAVGVLGARGASIRVRVTDGSTTVYDQTTAAGNRVFEGLPTPAGQRVIVNVAPSGGAASVEKLVLGSVTDLGTTEAQPTVGIVDYSRRETDDFGITTLVERAWAKRLGVRTRLSSNVVDALQAVMVSLRAKPALWFDTDALDTLAAYGFYKDFGVDLRLGDITFCSLTVESLSGTAAIADDATDAAVGGKSDLQLLRPLAITDAMLVSSSVAEADYAAWAGGTTYPAGARVIQAHRVYESLVAGNVGHEPTTSPTQWLDVRATNRWAMFDEALGSSTIDAGPIVVVLSPTSAISGLAVLDCDGAVRVQAPGYDRTIGGTGARLFTDLIAAAGANITVTISAPAGSGVASVGTLLIGSLLGMGTAANAPSIGITDYSRKDADDFGNMAVVERGWAKRLNLQAQIGSAAAARVLGRVASVRAQPALWIGSDGFDALVVYGLCRDFTLTLGENVSTCTLTLEGLTKTDEPDNTLLASIAQIRADALAAQADADAAAAVAGTKSRLSWGATPPAADDSVEDDRWADASNGYVEYRRLAGSGRIAIGGNRIVIGGAPILIRPWAPAPDSRIGYAVTTANQGVVDAAAARARADAANAAATDAIDRLDDLADDGVLTESEKKTVLIPQDARLEGAWTVLDAQAASYGVTTERTAAAAARTAWQTYRNALSPAWNNDSLPTTGINRTVYRQKLLDYETALTTLTKAITQVAKDAASIADAKAVAAQADATSGLAQVAIIRSNGYLDVSEKAAFKRQVTSYSAEYADIVAKATAAGVSSAMYATAYSDLISYLATLSPAWDNMSLDTAIVPATFDGKVTDYLFARQQLLNATADAIRAKAATAQTTADSKSKLIVRDTPPLASEQVENDEWVDSANGNRKYSRLAGSGAIAFSGNKLVFGGNGLAIRPYQLRRDFGIDYAQLTAQGAQTTADGKNTVFPPSTTAPTANKIGDLWPNPITGDVKVWNGTSWVLTSDQTALTQVVVEINPRAVTVAADYLGSLGAGWSHTITPKVTRGGVDVRAASISTYAITTSNLTATVNNTAGSASKGAVTVTDFSTDDGAYYDLVATVDGIAQPARRVTYSKKRSSPPPPASGTDSKSTDAFNPLTATTATAIIADMSVALAAGQRLVGTAGLDYYIDGTGSSPVTRTATVKWLYYAGGVWNDFDTAITGSSAFQEWTDAEGNTASRRPGHGEFNQAKSGLSAGTYPCRLVAYQNASGLTMTFSGVATIEAKP